LSGSRATGEDTFNLETQPAVLADPRATAHFRREAAALDNSGECLLSELITDLPGR